jgi:serine protease Do
MLSLQRTATEGRCQTAFRLLISTAALAGVVIWTLAVSAHADEIGANKSELIQSLLPTVVNISVKRLEAVSPAATTTTAAAASTADAATPAVDAAQTIKGYVGSGFVIDPSGLIVTNYHVVENAFEVTVMFSDGRRLPGKTLSASRLADLALIKVDADHPLPAAHWGDSDALQVGDQVLAAGNPFGLGLTITAGIVSALNRDIQNSPYDDLIQTDAPINHGNSGGPLFDMQGNVVGVDSTIISPTTGSVGIGFAMPSSSARFVIDQLRTYGWVRPGWIGVKVQQVTPEIAEAMGAARPDGSIVAWVLPDGPGKKAGLEIGDVILHYDGTAPNDERALLRAIAHTPVGNTITLTVWRDGAEHNIPINVKVWPRNQWDARDAPTPPRRPEVTIPPDLGLGLAPLSAEEKAKLASLGGVTGVTSVIVKSVVADSDPARNGMASGDIILRVQDKPVATPAEVRRGIDAARAGNRDFVLMLVLPKERSVPGPKWVALRLGKTRD